MPVPLPPPPVPVMRQPVLLCLGLCLSAATASFFSRDGDYRLAGLFQLHGLAPRAAARPLVDGCDE